MKTDRVYDANFSRVWKLVIVPLLGDSRNEFNERIIAARHILIKLFQQSRKVELASGGLGMIIKSKLIKDAKNLKKPRKFIFR